MEAQHASHRRVALGDLAHVGEGETRDQVSFNTLLSIISEPLHHVIAAVLPQHRDCVGLLGEPWDYVITVCDDANERCPWVPGSVQRLHWSFPDPSRAVGTEEQRLVVFRRVRDQIQERLTDWLRGR